MGGAGKSTAIKILVGEITPQVGTIWKASGLRMAYVAQHAFHHLEKHMQETPKKAKQDENNVVVPDAILNRRNKKKEKTYEYEVKWQFKPIENNVWVERDILIKMGYLKMVQREDEKQAAAAGLQTKQLTQPGIEKHLGNFGVDPESASHTQINQLSGGMKVKVVLAAAMWQNPHILILDEPTNYLDR